MVIEQLDPTVAAYCDVVMLKQMFLVMFEPMFLVMFKQADPPPQLPDGRTAWRL